jgi:uncharacterized protein (TIGR02231 family)
MRMIFLLLAMFSMTLSFAHNQTDTSEVDASLTHATVYFGYGAEINHEARVRVNNATRFIVINRLSTQIDVGSLQISCPEDMALLSHKYSVFNPTGKAARTPEVEKLEDSIAFIEKQMRRNGNLKVIEQETLTKTGILIEATVSSGGGKNLTSAEVLKLVEYYNTKIEKAKTAIFNYDQQERTFIAQIGDIRKRISVIKEAAAAGLKPYGQLVLQVLSKKSGEIPITLSYYTNNAGWTPAYDVRVNSKTNQVKLVYKASLTQTSGIDWKGTKLTLSTGTPTFGVAAPVLSPWYLQLYVPGLYSDLQRRAAFGNAQRNMLQSMVPGLEVKQLNDVYSVQADTILPSTLEQFITLNEGQLNTNYEIDLPYDIESDGELHSVTIKNEDVACLLKNFAVPRVDKDAYLLAEVADWQNLDLLPGEANIIMDETYIGKSIIDPNTTADTLNLSLGRDRRLTIKRSLIKELSSIKASGKENRQSFTYEIIVKNNKLTDVSLLLKDQHPLSTIKEVEVQLENTGDAMVNPETGVLTWKLMLKPGESKKVRFTYSVKYPKDKRIVNLK